MNEIAQMVKKFEKFKIQLEIFKKIKTGDKITKDLSGNLVIDPPDNLQFIRRWWNGDNKEKTCLILNNSFTEFMKFLDSILYFIRYKGFSYDICDLIKRISLFINNIIEGLHNLKFTYPNYAKIHCEIGSVIITFLDFKEEIEHSKKTWKKETVKMW